MTRRFHAAPFEGRTLMVSGFILAKERDPCEKHPGLQVVSIDASCKSDLEIGQGVVAMLRDNREEFDTQIWDDVFCFLPREYRLKILASARNLILILQPCGGMSKLSIDEIQLVKRFDVIDANSPLCLEDRDVLDQLGVEAQLHSVFADPV